MTSVLFWLNQLQETDRVQVGDQILTLQRLWQAHYPVRLGFIVPDGAMQLFWSKINWDNEILKDFPYLSLNFSFSQAAQIRFMAQTLQHGILNTPFDADWAADWDAAIQLWDGRLILTPYVWTTQDESVGASFASEMLCLTPLVCDQQRDQLELGLKTLWANLFQAHRLYVLQHLGLRLEQVHLSVLVQPLPAAKGSGWLKLGDRHLILEAVQGLPLDVWQGEGWFECYTYDSLSRQAHRFGNSLFPNRSVAGGKLDKSLSRVQMDLALTDVLSKTVLDLIWSWVDVRDGNSALQDAILTWILPDSSGPLSPQILGIAPDLPLPPPRPKAPTVELSSALDTVGGLDPNGLQCLGIGLAAAPGLWAAPAVVVHDFRQISLADLQGAILVTSHLEPMDLPWLKVAAGLICQSGGIASHGAIIGRELGFPVIVGVSGIFDRVQTGQWILVNGYRGEVYACSAEAAQNQPLVLPAAFRVVQTAQPYPSTETLVLVNLSQLLTEEQARQLPVDGVGLIRGEWLLFDEGTPLDTRQDWPPKVSAVSLKQRIRRTLQPIAGNFSPRPVYYRAADLRTSEADFLRHSKTPGPLEHNPDLGLRGTLRYVQDAHLFETELSVLKELLQAGTRNLHLILPYVRSPQEVKLCLQKIEAVGVDPQQDLPCWMMAEVPSVVYALEDYIALGIQGIAIGLNDLTQLLLGVDRNHPAFAEILDQNRFVVETAVKQLVQRATALDLPCLLYASLDVLNNEAWLDSLIRSGLSGISINLDAVVPARWAIAQAERRLADGANSADPAT